LGAICPELLTIMKCPACPGRSGAIAGRVQQRRGRLASGRLSLPSRDVRQSPVRLSNLLTEANSGSPDTTST
jgi:hypothetical protein